MVRATTTLKLAAEGPVLRAEDTGPEVLLLQAALEAAGFPCGEQDGEFGTATEEAVKGFQKSVGLLADGVVGPRTRFVLAAKKSAVNKAAETASSIAVSDATGSMTVQIASRMLPGAHLTNIKKHLPNVLDALRTRALGDRGMILVAIATIRAETAGFVPIDEGISKFNTSPQGPPFDLYDFRKELGNNGKGDGAKYKGRGFVQLTGRTNYRDIGNALGVPLLTKPELANDPETAARILAEFMKTKENRIKDDLLEDDLKDARRAVNGGKHGLDEFTDAFRKGDALLPA